MKSRIVAALLAFFIGGFGIHKFYLEKVGQGIIYLFFCWTFIPGIIAFIEAIYYLVMSDDEFRRKYDKAYSSPQSTSQMYSHQRATNNNQANNNNSWSNGSRRKL